MKNVKKMEMNQFKFGRFWRLMRVKFAESIRIVLHGLLVFVVVILAIRTGMVFLSLDNIPEGFEDGMKMMFQMPLLILLGFYFIGAFMIAGSENVFLCPVSNLERYFVMHTLAIFYMTMAAIVGIVSVELLWRLGLWLVFPSAYAQYVEVAAVFPFMEKFFSRVADFIIIFSAVYFYYQKIGQWENNKKYYEKKQKIIFYWLIPIVYLIVFLSGAFLLKFLGLRHLATPILLSLVILTDIYLIVTSYRSFCNYELIFEKTSTE